MCMKVSKDIGTQTNLKQSIFLWRFNFVGHTYLQVKIKYCVNTIFGKISMHHLPQIKVCFEKAERHVNKHEKRRDLLLHFRKIFRFVSLGGK